LELIKGIVAEGSPRFSLGLGIGVFGQLVLRIYRYQFNISKLTPSFTQHRHTDLSRESTDCCRRDKFKGSTGCHRRDTCPQAAHAVVKQTNSEAAKAAIETQKSSKGCLEQVRVNPEAVELTCPGTGQDDVGQTVSGTKCKSRRPSFQLVSVCYG
jgi:hypothetical protein